MTTEQLSVFLQQWFCGCGSPKEACKTLLKLLKLLPLHDHREGFEKLIPNTGLQYLILYTLDRFELTRHGGRVGGALLTDKGKQVLAALEEASKDDFESLNKLRDVDGNLV